MQRLVRLCSVLLVVGVSAPAFACRTGGGVGIQLGHVFFGFSKRHNCPPPVVVVQGQLPPVAYYTQTPPPVVYAPPPVVYSPPPIVYAAPPPQVAYANAPIVQAKVSKPKSDRPGILAVKYMPGVSTNPTMVDGELDFSGTGFAHSPGLEVRLTRWLSLRSDLEFRQQGRTWDMLGVKLSLFPNSPVKPYASVSFSGNESYANPGAFSFGFAGAGGLDVFFGKHFFLEAEVRYRMTPGNCCSDVPALTGVVGGGVAFF
ncbi:MAG: hypothetical protein Q8N23_26355 [Archangium sp.]|nr:hypothetical protein [Archangium sp.]MDP3571563.1 hypothetical protein [Archangium sp.]